MLLTVLLAQTDIPKCVNNNNNIQDECDRLTAVACTSRRSTARRVPACAGWAGAGCRPASHSLKLLPQYVNALSPPIAGERVGVGGWGVNGHLLEAYSTKPTCKPQSTMCSF